MSERENDSIEICLRIRIPQEGQAPRVLFDDGRRRQQDRRAFFHVITPAGQARVRMTSPGKGEICARGVETTAYARIYVHVYPGGLAGSPPPTPPAGAPWTVPDASGFWQFSSIGLANCRPYPPYAPNTLVVWKERPSGGFDLPEVCDFVGMCDTRTDCDTLYDSSTTACGGAQNIADTLPKLWRVCIKGFGGTASVFNGDWLLRFEPRGQGALCWSNSGDGREHVRVELRAQQLYDAAWELWFEQGANSVCYRHTGPWNCLGPNSFSSAVCTGLSAGSTIPACVEIVPQ